MCQGKLLHSTLLSLPDTCAVPNSNPNSNPNANPNPNPNANLTLTSTQFRYSPAKGQVAENRANLKNLIGTYTTEAPVGASAMTKVSRVTQGHMLAAAVLKSSDIGVGLEEEISRNCRLYLYKQAMYYRDTAPDRLSKRLSTLTSLKYLTR